MDRKSWLRHNSPIVTELFLENEEQLALIADGTYCFCQKSSNNYFQRKTYSGQKKRHLVKPFVICASDGLILDIYGFYGANDNDAVIIQDILLKDNALRDLLLPNDVLLFIRGFCSYYP